MEECGCKSAGVVVWWSVRDGGAQVWAEFLVMRVEKGAWGFWGSFGLRAAHGQGKYALAVPAATNRVSEERTTASKRQFRKVITVNEFGTGEKSDLGVKQRS